VHSLHRVPLLSIGPNGARLCLVAFAAVDALTARTAAATVAQPLRTAH
jgi:hypothetical protein